MSTRLESRVFSLERLYPLKVSKSQKNIGFKKSLGSEKNMDSKKILGPKKILDPNFCGNNMNNQQMIDLMLPKNCCNPSKLRGAGAQSRPRQLDCKVELSQA